MNAPVSAAPEPAARPGLPPPPPGGSGRIRVRGRIRRTLEILWKLIPFVVAFLRDRRRWILFGAPRRLPLAAHQARAARIVDAIAGLGPTFIKLVQVFSSRADIIPEPYLSEIARLQDAVPPLPVAAIEEVIVGEVGRTVNEVFDRFDRVPLAAASLGQVHRAVFRGEEVAVKVIRPGVERLVAVDLDISFRLLFFLNILFPSHHTRALTSAVREFDRRIHEELDLRQEAASTELFRQRFAGDPRVRAPRVVQELTRRQVLVTEFVHGTKVDRLHTKVAAGEISFPRVLDTLSEAYIRMMLVDGMLHADPHPGNILVQDDGTVVFLDFGMMLQVERATRERLFRLALAAARDDVDGIINAMYELGMIDRDISRAEIREAAVRIMNILERARELKHRRVQEMVQEIFDTFYTWPLILPEELVYFLRALVLLEGIGFRYDPDFNGLDVAKPVIQRMRGDLLQALRKEPGDLARGVVEELQHTLRALHDLVLRAEREELRLRAHPADVLHQERIAALLVRRLLLGLSASVLAIVSTLLFVATHNWIVLLVGNAAALFLFFLVLIIPKHLLENPLRHARSARRHRPG